MTTKRYEDVYPNSYAEQIAQLEQIILEAVSGKNFFNVVNIEAAVGKSRATHSLIRSHIADFTNPSSRNFLIVKKFKADVMEYSYGEDHHLHKKILAITSENWKEKWCFRVEDLAKFRVLVITHQRYVQLCLDEKLRKAFMENRHTLIVDEKLLFPNYTFTEEYCDTISKLLGSKRGEILHSACEPLFSKLDEYKVGSSNKCIPFKFQTKPQEVELLKAVIEAKRTALVKAKGVDLEDDDYPKDDDINKLKIFHDALDVWYSQTCIYNGGRITAVNPLHCFWTLKNNVILDASAGIDGIYDVGEYSGAN